MSYLFPATTITFDAALRDLAKGSPKARAAAAHALGTVNDETERRRAIAALLAALDDDRFEVRAEACCSLGDLAEPTDGEDQRDVSKIVPALIKRLDDGTPPVRQNAAIALGTIGHPDGFDALAEALRDGPADLRFQAATSLVEIDPARAYDPEVAALKDLDPQVVSAAALSLGAIADARAIPFLVARANHADPAARFDIAYALVELGDPTGRDTLVAALGDETRAWDAVSALGKLGTPDDVEALSRAVVAKKTPQEAGVFAAGTLLRLAPTSPHAEAARKLLVEQLMHRKAHVRALAVEQLGEVAGAWATGPLDKLAKSGKGTDLVDTIAAARAKIKERP